MNRTCAFSLALAVICACPNIGWTEDKIAHPAVVSADRLSKEQFKALPPDAMIDFKGERMSKRVFLQRRAEEFAQAVRQAQDMKTRAQAQFMTRRKAFLENEQAKLKAANKKVQAEVDRLVAADNSSHGKDWGARKRQAAQILAQAAKATPEHRAELERKANDLLAPASARR